MKKQALLVAALLMTGTALKAQVGVGTDDPQATLDIKAENSSGASTSTDGILIPRVDRERAQNMSSVETSTLIYVNNVATGSAVGKAEFIDAVGFYSFDGSKWQKFGSASDTNLYKDNGTLTSNRIVTMSDKTLSFNSTATTGTSHFTVDGATLSVDAVNNRIGIGTLSPDAMFDMPSGEAKFGTTSSYQVRLGAGYMDFYNNSGTLKGNVALNDTSGNLFINALASSGNTILNPSSGNVSVGTSLQWGKLAISDGGTSTLGIFPGKGYNGATTANSVQFDLGGTGNVSFDDNVTINGNVGIGTGTPGAKLEINNGTSTGAIKIVDGTQGIGKVLTSDANGVATWQLTDVLTITGSFSATQVVLPASDSSLPTGASITLPPGKWLIHLGSTVGTGVMGTSPLITNGSIWVTFTVQDEGSGTTESTTLDHIVAYSGQRAAAGVINMGAFKTFVSGAFAVNNSTSGDKTYYIWMTQERTSVSPSSATASGAFHSSAWERYLYALPIN